MLTSDQLQEAINEFGEDQPYEPAYLEGDEEPEVEISDPGEVVEEEKAEEAECEITDIAPVEPLPIVLSISERAMSLFNAMEMSIEMMRADPENFTTLELWSCDYEGSHYVGTLYTNTDTGEDYKIVRDGKDYWL